MSGDNEKKVCIHLSFMSGVAVARRGRWCPDSAQAFRRNQSHGQVRLVMRFLMGFTIGLEQ